MEKNKCPKCGSDEIIERTLSNRTYYKYCMRCKTKFDEYPKKHANKSKSQATL